MKNMLNKKGMNQTWWIIATAVVVLIVVVLIIFWFRDAGEAGFGELDETIENFGDKDCDGISDFFDKCPNQGYTGENDNYPGCPPAVDTDAKLKEYADKEANTLCGSAEAAD